MTRRTIGCTVLAVAAAVYAVVGIRAINRHELGRPQ